MDQSMGKQNTHARATASAPRNYACSLPLTFGYCTPLAPFHTFVLGHYCEMYRNHHHARRKEKSMRSRAA